MESSTYCLLKQTLAISRQSIAAGGIFFCTAIRNEHDVWSTVTVTLDHRDGIILSVT